MTCVPSGESPSRSRVVSVNRLTLAMLGNASPRKPMVVMAARSSALSNDGLSLGALFPPDRQAEGKDRAAARFAAGADFAVMIVHNFFADRQAETGALRFAMSGERLEQAGSDFRGDAFAAVLNFR